MSDFHKRKAERTKLFQERQHIRLTTCSACNGSGRYDNTGSPKCGACNGTGREEYKPIFGQKFYIAGVKDKTVYRQDEDIVRIFKFKEEFESRFDCEYVVKNMNGEVINSLSDYYLKCMRAKCS